MKQFTSLVLAFCLMLTLAACAGAPASSQAQSQSVSASASTAPAALPTQDRAGNPIALPQQIERIIVLAPSLAETVIALGDAAKIIAIDTQTQAQGYSELAADLPAFDLMTPDAEKLAALAPDVILVSGMSMALGENPFQPLLDMGICVVCVPTSDSISGIYEDIAFLGDMLGRSQQAQQLSETLKTEVDRIAAIGATVPAQEKKTVYFEIAAAPYAYSFGSGVYLNEMIELIGAENVFAAQTGWMSVESESALAANPDVILTNVNYLDDPVAEIKSREGWQEVTAVKNNEVYYVDNMASSLANQNIVTALQQMAEAVYPQLYAADKAA